MGRTERRLDELEKDMQDLKEKIEEIKDKEEEEGEEEDEPRTLYLYICYHYHEQKGVILLSS